MAQIKPYTDKAMRDHASTYIGFKAMLRWGIVVVAVILVGLAIFAV